MKRPTKLTLSIKLEQHYPTSPKATVSRIKLTPYSQITGEFRILTGPCGGGYTNIQIDNDLFTVPVGGKLVITANR